MYNSNSKNIMSGDLITYEGCKYNEAKRLKNDHLMYFKIAQNVAKKSTMTQKHGCVIVHKGKILSEATNVMPKCFNDSIHAEIHAILKAKKIVTNWKNIDLYIVRIGQKSMKYPLKFSKPCENCKKYIEKIGVGRVFYSTNYELDMLMNDNYICKEILLGF